jgi:hypothetical protein
MDTPSSHSMPEKIPGTLAATIEPRHPVAPTLSEPHVRFDEAIRCVRALMDGTSANAEQIKAADRLAAILCDYERDIRSARRSAADAAKTLAETSEQIVALVEPQGESPLAAVERVVRERNHFRDAVRRALHANTHVEADLILSEALTSIPSNRKG